MAVYYNRNTVLTRPAGSARPTFGSGYSIVVLKAGSVVSQTVDASTLLYVYDGSSFTAGDKIMVNADRTSMRTITQVTTNILHLNAAISVSQGDKVVNLGADTGSVLPNLDGSPVKVCPTPDPNQDPEYSSATLLTNTEGEYEYWADVQDVWELVVSPTGEIVDIVLQYGNASVGDGEVVIPPVPVDERVTYVSAYATGGTGTAADPWTGWESVFTSAPGTQGPVGDFYTDYFTARTLKFDRGYYLMASRASFIYPSAGLRLIGDGDDATVIISESSDGAFYVDLTPTLGSHGNPTHIRIEDLSFLHKTATMSVGSAFIDIVFANRVHIKNVNIRGNFSPGSASLTENASAIRTKEVNYHYISDLYIVGANRAAATSGGGPWGVGLDLGAASVYNRGNVGIFGTHIERCNIGVRVAYNHPGGSGGINNVQLYNVKCIHAQDGVASPITPGMSGCTEGTYGLYCGSPSQLVNLTVNGCHFEGFNVSAYCTGLRAVSFIGTMFARFEEGTTPAGVRLVNCDNFSILNNVFTTNATSGGRGTAIDVVASSRAPSGMFMNGNLIQYVTTRFSLSGAAAGSVNSGLVMDQGGMGGGTSRLFDTKLTVGRGLDENMSVTFARASGDKTIAWDNATDRFAIGPNLYVSGTLTHQGARTMGAPVAFVVDDATPSVDAKQFFKTANENATAITRFDYGLAGQRIYIIVEDTSGGTPLTPGTASNTTFKFSNTLTPGTYTIIGNSGVDYAANAGDMIVALFDGTYWYCDIIKVTT